MDAADPETRPALEEQYQKKARLLQKQNQDYNQFCAENDLKPLPDRLKIAGWDRKQAAKATAVAKKVAPSLQIPFHGGTISMDNIVSYTPEELKTILEEAGFEVKPLAKGSLKGVSFEDGGGFKINFEDGGLLQFHPETGSHHGGAYYKISTGKGGIHRYGLDGKERFPQ